MENIEMHAAIVSNYSAVFAKFVTAITGSGSISGYACKVTSKPRGLP